MVKVKAGGFLSIKGCSRHSPNPHLSTVNLSGHQLFVLSGWDHHPGAECQWKAISLPECVSRLQGKQFSLLGFIT